MDDIEAIKQLKARHLRSLDTKDWESYRRACSDDILLDASSSGGPVWRGIEELVGDVPVRLAGVVTVHHGHMPEITITSPTTATGIWALEDRLQHPDGREVHGFGHSHDTYAKLDGEWRITSITLTRLRVDVTEPRPT
jgi:hypothetical protein